MNTTWKVSTNYRLFDYKKVQQDVRSYYKGERFDPVRIFQSKGNAHMVHMPQIGDMVYFSCKKMQVLIGKVIQGFSEGTSHHHCPYSKGGITEHRVPMVYATIEIIGVGDGSEFKGVQRTWSKCY